MIFIHKVFKCLSVNVITSSGFSILLFLLRFPPSSFVFDFEIKVVLCWICKEINISEALLCLASEAFHYFLVLKWLIKFPILQLLMRLQIVSINISFSLFLHPILFFHLILPPALHWLYTDRFQFGKFLLFPDPIVMIKCIHVRLNCLFISSLVLTLFRKCDWIALHKTGLLDWGLL